MGVFVLTKKILEDFAILQRRILRSIIGWSFNSNDSYADVMRNMKFKMERAMQIQYVESSGHRILKQQINYMIHLTSLDPSHPARLILDWNPCDTLDASYEYMPFRSPGRPKNKWTHFLLSFSRNAKQVDLCEWIANLPRHIYSKQELQKEYIQYILA